MTLRRFNSFLLLLLSIAFRTLAAENPPQIPPQTPPKIPTTTTQTPEGRIFFPTADAKTASANTVTWQYKPTRWGMYQLVLILATNAPANPDFQIQIVGQDFTSRNKSADFGPDMGFLLVSKFYLAKAEPFELRVTAANSAQLKGLLAVLVRPAPEGKPIVQSSGPITLHARDALVSGVMLRYEPATNKNCLGYWTNPNDSALWSFEVTKPGTYDIELWQGCGKGQGGSEVSVIVNKLPATIISSDAGRIRQATFIVEDTGHFQNFIPRALGTVTFHRPGPYALSVKPISKKAAAVMDIRQIVLKPSTAPKP